MHGPKGDAGNPILNILSKATSAFFSQYARDQQVPAYNCSFVSIIKIYDCKQVPGGLLNDNGDNLDQLNASRANSD